MPHSVGGMMECGLRADDPAQSLLDSICSVNAHFPPFPKLHFQRNFLELSLDIWSCLRHHLHHQIRTNVCSDNHEVV